MKIILMVFLKKLFVKQAHHIGPKNDASSELLIRCKDFLKFCTMKGAKRYMKMILNFPKKYSLGQLSYFGPNCFTFCTMQGTKRYFKIMLMVFPEIFFFGADAVLMFFLKKFLFRTIGLFFAPK